jgi:hypothetical protein
VIRISKTITLKVFLDYEKYNVFNNNKKVGYFFAYNNPFHQNNKYIKFDEKTFNKLNNKEYFEAIKNYFNKPLQIIISEKEKSQINELEELGFTLRRTTHCYTFTKNDLIKRDITPTSINFYTKGSKEEFMSAQELSYKHYIKTHESVNPLTASKKDFFKWMPLRVVCEVKGGVIINTFFIDDETEDICYFGSSNGKSFKDFVYQALIHLFEETDILSLEVDSTDPLALEVQSLFIDKEKDTYYTYIFN